MEDEEQNINKKVAQIGMGIQEYQVDKPYPEAQVTKEDRIYLPIIFENYGSRISEYTAISQYTFSHFTLDNICDEKSISKEAAEAFLNISIVEMFHLEFLGEIIVKLGDYPMFVNSKKKDWKSSFVPYGTTLKNHIELAIKSEREAINQYENSMKLINNQSLNDLISRIIEDEKLHLQIFSKIYNKVI